MLSYANHSVVYLSNQIKQFGKLKTIKEDV